MVNKIIAGISATLAAVLISFRLGLQEQPEPIRVGVGLLVLLILATPVFEWQWRRAWWMLPLWALGAGALMLVPVPHGHIQLLFPAVILIGLVVQYIRRQRKHRRPLRS